MLLGCPASHSACKSAALLMNKLLKATNALCLSAGVYLQRQQWWRSIHYHSRIRILNPFHIHTCTFQHYLNESVTSSKESITCFESRQMLHLIKNTMMHEPVTYHFMESFIQIQWTGCLHWIVWSGFVEMDKLITEWINMCLRTGQYILYIYETVIYN